MRILLIIFIVFLSSCSSTKSIVGAADFTDITKFEPYSLNVSANSPQMDLLIREYLSLELGKYLEVQTFGNGVIEIIFATHDQENDYSKWQNSTMLMIVKDNSGNRLWAGEYNYKGGMELSGFIANSPAEASKLVAKRIVEKFARDYSL